MHGERGGFSRNPIWNGAPAYEANNWYSPLQQNTLITARTFPTLKVMAN